MRHRVARAFAYTTVAVVSLCSIVLMATRGRDRDRRADSRELTAMQLLDRVELDDAREDATTEHGRNDGSRMRRGEAEEVLEIMHRRCLLYTSPSPRDS